MPDIGEWLEALDLGEYAKEFKAEKIKHDDLRHLTEADLKDLGLSIGPRRRALAAIANMVADQPVPKPEDTGLVVEQSRAAGRRQLTVMFCDLVGSTALSERLDPEDLRDVMRAYQDATAGAIARFDGYIAQTLGDGLMVYFGYPTAHEDDAQRAVLAGLDILAAIERIKPKLSSEHGFEIAVRIGIHTGIVVAGEVGASDTRGDMAIVGETPNVAARVEAFAEANTIVVSARARDPLGDDLFDFEDLGVHDLKGVQQPVQLYRVIGARAADRHETDGDTAVPPLIGRDEETGLLRRAWQSTKDGGRGQVVMISGEAGIGKSVLVERLMADVRAEGLPRVTMRSSPYHTGSALYPLIEHFKRLARWQPEDSDEARLAKLEATLEPYEQPIEETVPLLASLLSLLLPEDRYPPLTLTPQQQKQLTLDAIVAMTMEDAERRPFLQLWEDLHWADPSTLELVGLLIEQTPTVPLLIGLTARSEFVPPWPARSHITPITLNRLERPHAEALIARIAGMKSLPKEVVDHIVTKTDGVPLYVEELTKTILGSDILRDTGEHFELTGPLASLTIPDTLQESLMARLDRLPQVRELAQLGSVLGREFAYGMISGLSTTSESTLLEGLEQLVDNELLYQRGRPPRARYTFKHALLQDAAYNSLLRRTRQQYHQQVAELLEDRFPNIVEAQPELLAHHYSTAGMADKAVAHWLEAGRRAARASANAEACANLKQGLEQLSGLPKGGERGGRELDLLTTLGPALIASKGYAAPEVGPTYRRALELCQALGDIPQQYSALHGLWFFHYVQADLGIARELAEQLVELAKVQQDSGLNLAANRSLGTTLIFLGELEASRLCLEQVIASYDPAIHGVYTLQHGGADLGVASMGQTAWSSFALGYPDQAIDRMEQGLALSRQLNHPFSETYAHTAAAAVHQFRGEPQRAQQFADAAIGIAKDRGFALYLGWAGVLRGWAWFEQGGGTEAITEVRNGIDASRATGAGIWVPYFLAMLASTYGRAGQTQDGLVAVTDALADVARTGERFWEAELYRIKGQLLLESDAADESEAEDCFRRAIEIAGSQGAKSWELRAATSLARLWSDHEKRAEAFELLSPIYDWFTEGFDTADLKEAKALLDELK